MELKQMEYLIAAAECGSFSKASERLYTTQPNVSKVLKSLEDELNVKILKRTPKGVTLTKFGEETYEYAKEMIKTAYIIEERAGNSFYTQLKIASYSSNYVSGKLADFYMDNCDMNFHIEFLTGNIEEVVENVSQSIVNIGIIYYPEYQKKAFQKSIESKELKYEELKKCSLCLYVGKRHPYYDLESLTFEALENQKIIQSKSDYFSIVGHIDSLSQNRISINLLKHIVHTNSQNTMINMVSQSNLCTLGIELDEEQYEGKEVRKIPIEECEKISVGYIIKKNYIVKNYEESFLECLKGD